MVGRGFLVPAIWVRILVPQPVLFMVAVAKLVKAVDCDSTIRGFESHLSPQIYGSVVQFIG